MIHFIWTTITRTTTTMILTFNQNNLNNRVINYLLHGYSLFLYTAIWNDSNAFIQLTEHYKTLYLSTSYLHDNVMYVSLHAHIHLPQEKKKISATNNSKALWEQENLFHLTNCLIVQLYYCPNTCKLISALVNSAQFQIIDF